MLRARAAGYISCATSDAISASRSAQVRQAAVLRSVRAKEYRPLFELAGLEHNRGQRRTQSLGLPILDQGVLGRGAGHRERSTQFVRLVIGKPPFAFKGPLQSLQHNIKRFCQGRYFVIRPRINDAGV